jgi:Spy/CpxP family protein refolding chaperone
MGVPAMKRSRYVFVALALALLMLSSAWLGALLALRTQPRSTVESGLPGPAVAFLERLERWQRVSSLTEDQRRRVAAALDRARTEARELAGDSARRAMEIRRRLRAEIDPLLTPAQRAELDRRPPFPPRFFPRRRPDPALPGATNSGPVPPDP